MDLSNVSQAAQFDGPMNAKIETVAVMAWGHQMNYKSYLLYADHAQTTAVSEAEYQAICNDWDDTAALMKECMHRADVHGVNHHYEKVVAKASINGVAAVSIFNDENDKILIEHWDSNILFNQRNHTE